MPRPISALRRLSNLLILAAATTVALLPAPAAGAASPTDFSSTAQRALLAYPDVSARLKALRAQQRASDAARSGHLPRVDLYAGAGPERSEITNATGGVSHEAGRNSRVSVTLRQSLYDGAEVASETRRQARLANLRLLELRQAEDALLGQLLGSWVDVGRQRRLVEIARENLRAHEAIVALVRQRVAARVGRGVDLEQARARVASAQLMLHSDEGALAEALARFRRFAMRPATGELAPLRFPVQLLPTSEREAVEQALQYSLEARAAAENAAATQAELDGRRAQYAPRIALEGRHDFNARTAVSPHAATSSLLLTLNYNLYAGGGDRAREDDAALRVEQRRLEIRDALIAARQQVGAAWADARREAATYQDASAYVEAVSRARDAYRVQFDIGQRSLLDLLNSEGEVTQARRQSLNAQRQAVLSQARLLLLTGRFTEAFELQRLEAAAASSHRPSAGSTWLRSATMPTRPAGRCRSCSSRARGRSQLDRAEDPAAPIVTPPARAASAAVQPQRQTRRGSARSTRVARIAATDAAGLVRRAQRPGPAGRLLWRRRPRGRR
ncbi:MAG: TolC family protein [Burkholderiaceae bacterium]